MSRSIADWRKLADDWRFYGCLKLAEDLTDLLDTLEALTKRDEVVEEWMGKNAESDSLRAALYPRKPKT